MDHDDSGYRRLYYMDIGYNLTPINNHFLPDGRNDVDLCAIEFDPTGLYGNLPTVADWDWNDDNLAALYQISETNDIIELWSSNDAFELAYIDLCYSNGGTFGQKLYVTNPGIENILTIDPNGDSNSFASGFNNIRSITLDDTSNLMYVSDMNGIWRIRANSTEIGPQIMMQEPKVPLDETFTNEEGIDSVRFLWNGRIQFIDSDVEILNEDSDPVSFSTSGSGSQFMIIAFGQKLLNDKYTINIHDTVVSAETSNPIDGDNDGFAGGDAIIVMEHRERHDSENDNDIDFADFASFANKWLWSE